MSQAICRAALPSSMQTMPFVIITLSLTNWPTGVARRIASLYDFTWSRISWMAETLKPRTPRPFSAALP
jgi:hypothetical protein